MTEYTKACDDGKKSADELIGVMQATQNPTLLGATVAKMISAGNYDGFEIGFFHRIASSLLKS